ncbi:MAG: polysaccharide deacetylase family protein [Leptospiraceae bacterium]|nr:polysaccharide deacetylase family protein [Leptospiraceae bacterium]MCK6382028.1 polysaccharide deacetylase family protein [Leptospiraceae bacterium]
MEENLTEEERAVQQIVNEFSKESSEYNEYEIKRKKLFLFGIITFASAILISIFIYTISSFYYLKSQIEKKEQELEELEQNYSSLLLQEESKEEELLKLKESMVKIGKSDIDLNDVIKQNIESIRLMNEGATGFNISRGNVNFKEIALTFDLSSGEDLRNLYDYIQKYDIRTTIFISNEVDSDLTGALFLSENISMLKKLASLGEKVEFGNHTWSHFNHHRSLFERSFRKRLAYSYLSDSPLSFELMGEQILKVENKFKEITGREISKIYRLPYGSMNQLILNSYAKLGYDKHIFWSSNGPKLSLAILDYITNPYISKFNSNTKKKELIKNPNYWTSSETKTILFDFEKKDKHGMNGAIILMHLGTKRKFDKLFYVLPEFISEMKKKGYSFVTVSEVLNDKQD